MKEKEPGANRLKKYFQELHQQKDGFDASILQRKAEAGQLISKSTVELSEKFAGSMAGIEFEFDIRPDGPRTDSIDREVDRDFEEGETGEPNSLINGQQRKTNLKATHLLSRARGHRKAGDDVKEARAMKWFTQENL